MSAVVDKISEEVIEIPRSPKFIQNKLNEVLKLIKKDITKIKSEMKKLIEDNLHSNLLSNKIIKLQDRSQMNNFQIERITEQPDKIWEEYKEKIMRVIKDKSTTENLIYVD